ncbi:hypothetical protein BGX21_000082 [Mortierella sp. AD011]|nr:hypothetical protein BGX20_007842 [Mortierella sp. AD010]KAF9389519.1 hypothetical protein BGX21_000082 [Mortierella sp. AD011]
MSRYDEPDLMAGMFEVEQDRYPMAPEQKGLKRDLRLRHMIMIAISGTIGTGLFLTSGIIIQQAGPAGALLAYFLVGVWLVFVSQAIGEIATLLPLPGAFNAWGARVFDEAFSFQMTWMYFINWALTIPAELSAAAVIVGFWLPEGSHFHTWIVPLIGIVLMIFINLAGVKTYGELEYWFSILKVVTIIMFIVCAILVDAGALGGVTYGMKSWSVPGAPFNNGFTGFLKTFVAVGYSYGGTELTGVTAAESRNPHKHVPKAVNLVAFRIVFFYIASIFLLGNILAVNSPELVGENGSAATAPFTVVFAHAGIKGAANFMNSVVFISVFSTVNSDFYVSTRMLLSLARNGWAPSIVGYTNVRGVPVVAVVIVTLFSCLSLITVFVASGIVFSWLISILGAYDFQVWIFILLLHFRFRYCWKSQDRHVQELPYVSWGYPYGNIVATVIGFCCILATLYLSFIDFPTNPGPDASSDAIESYKSSVGLWARNFLGAWFPWVSSAILYFSYKFIKGTKIVKAEEADLDTGRFVPTESDKADLAAHRSWRKKLMDFIL